MTVTEAGLPARRRTMLVPRSRGAVSGFLLILLGAWGALVPFFGPYLDYSYGTDQAWHWTAARGWLEVLPGVAVALGGLLLLISAHRVSASFGGWLAALGGAWFIVGQTVAPLLHLGNVGQPLSHHDSGRAVAQLGYFLGLGTVIVFLAAFALGRLAVVGVRDVLVAERAAEAAREEELARRRAAEHDAAAGVAARDGVARDGVVRDGVADDRVATRDGVARDGVVRDGVTRDGVADERLREDRGATGQPLAQDARYEPDQPYRAQTADEPTTRYNPDVVGSDYGTATRSPAHQAPGEDGR
jgi:hypothetical protein